MVKCDCTDFTCVEKFACRQMSDELTQCTILGDGRVYLNRDATCFSTLLVGSGERGRGKTSEEYAFSLQGAESTEICEKLARVKKVQVCQKWSPASSISGHPVC
ncbi:hypothetical protein KIN20_011339 [Parelaphostrongylus tenuis]|uniref:Uncharacterized protein n=1 Tax=Parelaphostrongylus tenuis TaxID=148309 RepID=A0AAD5MV94_PARTN|nr:hypothetical protein KIN20_011339 [Parelaphostrongylus tenuis]